VLILPYIEQGNLFNNYRFDEPWDGPNNRTLANLIPRTYQFPSTHIEGKLVANYLAVVGSETIWPGKVPYQKQPNEGGSTTILLVENEGLNIHWMEPRDLLFSEMSFELQKPNGISSPYRQPGVVMADGSLRSFQEGISPETLRSMLIVKGINTPISSKVGWKTIDDGRNRELKDDR
jgi:hypothetical protein